MRLNWQDEVLFPHEAASNNICYLNQAVQALEEGEIEEALKALYEVDNNCYAFLLTRKSIIILRNIFFISQKTG